MNPTPLDTRFVSALADRYQVSPDGTKLLVVKGVDAHRLIVVHNWASEVRAKLRSARATAGR